MTTVRNQCREFRLTIISKVFFFWSSKPQRFCQVGCWPSFGQAVAPSWQIPHWDSVSLADAVCCASIIFFFLALWAFSEAGEMAVGSALSFYFFGHAIDVREGPVK